MTDEALTGELLPSETDEQAAARVERRARAEQGGLSIEIDMPGGTTSVRVTEDEFRALKADQMYIGFYNLSRVLPDPEDFEGLMDKSDEEREEMGLPPRRPQTRLHKYLPDPSQPLSVSERVGLAPIHMEVRGRWRGPRTEVLNVRLTWQVTAWVTHFAIGTKKDGVLLSAQLNAPLAVRPGNGLKLALKMDDVRAMLQPLDSRAHLVGDENPRALPDVAVWLGPCPVTQKECEMACRSACERVG